MLIPCPECGSQVSEKAPTCPKCGAVIAYPPFYTTVDRDGLRISTVLCSWWNEYLDDSAFGSGAPIQCLSQRTDDAELVQLTFKNRRKLMDAMSNRMMQLPKSSPEAKTLKLTIEYVLAAGDFAIIVNGCYHRETKMTAAQVQENIACNLKRLEAIKSECSDSNDLKLINSEIEACRAFGEKFQAPSNSPDTQHNATTQVVLTKSDSGKSRISSVAPNYYKILNLAPTASEAEIKKALHEALRLWINRNNAPQTDRRQEAKRMVKLLEEAETVLLNAAKRAEYDRQQKNAPQQEAATDKSVLDAVQDLVAEGRKLLAEGNIVDALYVATKATERDGGSSEAWALLGRARFLFGDVEDAIYEYKRAIKLKPNEGIYYSELGDIYNDSKRYDDALIQYKRAAQVEPGVAWFRAEVGRLLARQGNLEEAVQILEECLKEEPNVKAFRNLLGLAYLDSGRKCCTVDPESGNCFPTSKAQVLAILVFIQKAERLNTDDADLKSDIEKNKQALRESIQRKYHGSTGAAVLGGFIWLLLYGLGLIFLPFYFYASRPPRYAFNKSILGQEATGTQKTFQAAGKVADMIGANENVRGGIGLAVFIGTGLFLPIMAIVNYVKNYTGENDIKDVETIINGGGAPVQIAPAPEAHNAPSQNNKHEIQPTTNSYTHTTEDAVIPSQEIQTKINLNKKTNSITAGQEVRPTNSNLPPPPVLNSGTGANRFPIKLPNKKILVRISLLIALLASGVLAIRTFTGKTTLAYQLILDGKPLNANVAPLTEIDDKPFTAGGRLSFGRHKFVVKLLNAERYESHFWIINGTKNLGTLQLESSKGSLVVSVKPTPTSLTLKHNADVISQNLPPYNLNKLSVGDYTLIIRKGEYEETRTIHIQREQQSIVEVELNLGSVVLSCEPTNATFRLAGNGRHWEGELPIRIDEVPVGNYSLAVTQKGWEMDSQVEVTRGCIANNKIEFPYASVVVTSEPKELAITSEGTEFGKTPVTLYMRPGKHTLTVTDGENSLNANISLGPKESTNHVFVFRYGEVQLSSIPPGATVVRRGKDLGKTPLTLSRIPVGESFVELRLDGYAITNLAISASGSTTKLSVKMTSEALLSALRQARGALDADRLEDSQKAIVAALKIDPNDPTALNLKNEQVKATARAEARQKEAEQLETIRIIDRAIAARGGQELCKNFNAYKTRKNISGTDVSGNTYTGTVTVNKVFSKKYRIDQELTIYVKPKSINVFGGLITATMSQGDSARQMNETYCVTADSNWSTRQTSYGVVSHTMSSDHISSMRASLLEDCYFQLLPLLQNGYQLKKELNFSNAPENSTTVCVKKDGYKDVYLHFDNSSGLLVGTDSFEKESNKWVRSGERYSNFHLIVGGIQDASTVQVFSDGVLTQTTQTIYSQALNGLPDSVFLPGR